MNQKMAGLARWSVVLTVTLLGGMLGGCAAPDSQRELYAKMEALREGAVPIALQDMRDQGFAAEASQRFKFYQNPLAREEAGVDGAKRRSLKLAPSFKVAWQFRIDHVDPRGSCKVEGDRAFHPLMIQMEFNFRGGYLTRSDPPQAINWIVDCASPSKDQVAVILGEGKWIEDERRPLSWASVSMTKEAQIKLSYRSRSADGSVGPWISTAVAFASSEREQDAWRKAVWSQRENWPEAKSQLVDLGR